MTLLLVVLCALPVMVESVDLRQEYFTTAVFHCNKTEHNFTNTSSVSARYWLLPNGSFVSGSHNGSHITVDSDFTLTVNKIDDIDFGYYFCLFIRSDYTADNIKHGLNVDGPYFGDLAAIYSRKAMIGGIAGGSLFVILAGTCLVSQFGYHKRNQRNKAVDDLDKAIDGYDLKSYHNVGLEVDEGAAKEAKTKGASLGNGDHVTVEDNRF